MSQDWQSEAMRRLRQMQARGGGRGGGGPQMPRGSPTAIVGALLLTGGAYALSNSLFNVDGGHRAIKYKRISGVSKEIYNEGEQRHARERGTMADLVLARHALQHPLVRDARRVRRACEAA